MTVATPSDIYSDHHGPQMGIEYASRDEIIALQTARAKNTLRHAYYNVLIIAKLSTSKVFTRMILKNYQISPHSLSPKRKHCAVTIPSACSL